MHSCVPLNFFAACPASAVDVAGLDVADDEEDEEEEEEEEEVVGLGIDRITLAVGSTFICCLCPSELRNGASVLLKYGDEL